MTCLLLDSSDKYLSVGLSRDGILIDEINYQAWQKQSEFMIKEIKNILDRNKMGKDDIDGVVSTFGPGSYTGVRISLTIAKTMAFALSIPLYLASSLECFRKEGIPTICLMNARSKRSYFAVYKDDEEIIAPTIKTNDEVLEYISSNPSFALGGDLGYLGLSGGEYGVSSVLARCADEKHLCRDVLSAKPIYLKDTYLR